MDFRGSYDDATRICDILRSQNRIYSSVLSNCVKRFMNWLSDRCQIHTQFKNFTAAQEGQVPKSTGTLWATEDEKWIRLKRKPLYFRATNFFKRRRWHLNGFSNKRPFTDLAYGCSTNTRIWRLNLRWQRRLGTSKT